MIKLHLRSIKPENVESIDFAEISKRTKHYSGADIRSVCRDASMIPMRRAITGKSPAEVKDMQKRGKLDLKLENSDFFDAIGQVKASVSTTDLDRYEKWEKEFGSTVM